MVFAYDTYTKPSKNNVVLGATLTKIPHSAICTPQSIRSLTEPQGNGGEQGWGESLREERVGHRPPDAPCFETWLHILSAGRGRPGPTKISRAGKIRNRSRRSREACRRIRNQLCLPRKEGNLDSEVSARSLLTGRQAIKVVPMQTGARCVPRR